MVLTSKELIGKLQPEVRILPATIHPRCLGSESMARGVGTPGDRWQPSAIWPTSGEQLPPAKIVHRVGLVVSRQPSARHDGDVWPEG